MSGRGDLESLVVTVERIRSQRNGFHPVVCHALRAIFAGPEACRSNATLAREAACGSRTLYRWFLRQVGVPPVTFVREVAIYQSLRLLVEQPYGSLEEIATRSGYRHARSLARAWKRSTGTTPAFAARVLHVRARDQSVGGCERADLVEIAREIDEAHLRT